MGVRGHLEDFRELWSGAVAFICSHSMHTSDHYAFSRKVLKTTNWFHLFFIKRPIFALSQSNLSCTQGGG